jgi:putative lipoprotein
VPTPLAALAAATVLLVAGGAAAQRPDEVLHFGVSAGIAAGGYGVGLALFDDRPAARAEGPRLALGGSAALVAGVGKEIWDALGSGHPSWGDIVWDVLGTLVGLGVMLALDVLLGSSASPDAGDSS